MPGRPLTVLFMPESAFGPTGNCIGVGDVLRRRGHRVVFAAEASWKGRLEPLGFEEDLVDLLPARGTGPAGCRGVLEGVHRQHRAGVPQALHRAAGHLDQAGLGGADQRRAVLPGAAGRDRGADPPGCDRRRQCDLLPRVADRRRAVRQDRVLQPPRDPRPGAAARVLRLPGRGPGAVAGVPGRVRPGAPRPVGGVRRLGQPGRAPRPSRTWNSSTPARSTSTSTRRSPITGGPGRSGRAGTGWIPRSGRRTSRSPCPGRWLLATGRSSTSRSARWGRPTWP